MDIQLNQCLTLQHEECYGFTDWNDWLTWRLKLIFNEMKPDLVLPVFLLQQLISHINCYTVRLVCNATESYGDLTLCQSDSSLAACLFSATKLCGRIMTLRHPRPNYRREVFPGTLMQTLEIIRFRLQGCHGCSPSLYLHFVSWPHRSEIYQV